MKMDVQEFQQFNIRWAKHGKELIRNYVRSMLEYFERNTGYAPGHAENEAIIDSLVQALSTANMIGLSWVFDSRGMPTAKFFQELNMACVKYWASQAEKVIGTPGYKQ
jgi:hypothetical protein